jgi:cytidylate kinase
MTSIESIIDRQLKRWEFQKLMASREVDDKPKFRPIITVSRTFGSFGEEIAARLAELTGFRLLDREILDAIASDFGIQSRMVELHDENTRSELESWFDGIIRGRIIDSSDYLKSLAKTIGSIMTHGETILIGRGANIIIGPARGFHVRIVAPLETRIKRISSDTGVSAEEAAKTIEENDSRRMKFVKKSFGVDINDPARYDLIINSGTVDIDGAVELAMLAYGKKERELSR